jgi:hypothetical protein
MKAKGLPIYLFSKLNLLKLITSHVHYNWRIPGAEAFSKNPLNDVAPS